MPDLAIRSRDYTTSLRISFAPLQGQIGKIDLYDAIIPTKRRTNLILPVSIG